MDDRGEISAPYSSDRITIVHSSPDMYEPLALIVVDSRDPDLAKNDRPICGRCAGDEYEVLIEIEAHQFMVGEVRCARPHPGFVFTPVPAGFDYLLFDDGDHHRKCFQSVLCWWVRGVKVQLFCGCFDPHVRRSRWVTGTPICHLPMRVAMVKRQSISNEGVDHRRASLGLRLVASIGLVPPQCSSAPLLKVITPGYVGCRPRTLYCRLHSNCGSIFGVNC